MGRPRKNPEEAGASGDVLDVQDQQESENEVQSLREEIKKQGESIQSLTKSLDNIVGILENFSKRESNNVIKESQVNVSQQTKLPQDHFPLTFRSIINEILNHKFSATVQYRTDGHFELAISVPREYSNAVPNHWETFHGDMRVKVIPNALSESGVREYCQLIAKNLGEVIMSRVQLDKNIV